MEFIKCMFELAFCRDPSERSRDEAQGGIVKRYTKEDAAVGAGQTECRKSHVNSGRRLICKHNARQLYGLPSSGRMRSLRVSPVSLVNFSRRPVRPSVYRYFVPLRTASLCIEPSPLNVFNDRFLVRSSARPLRFSTCRYSLLLLNLRPRFASFRTRSPGGSKADRNMFFR